MALPPPAQLQPVISNIAEWLALLAADAGVAIQPPRTWSPTEWRYARVIAHIQGIAPLLHLRGAGAYGDDVWRTFLEQQYHRNTHRNTRILALFGLIQVGAMERRAPVLPLKGVSLITWLYDNVGVRPMSDIDVFTPPEHEATVRAVIESAGFRLVDRLERHRVYARPPNVVVDLHGEHPDNPIKLELHTRLYDDIPHEEYDLTALFVPCCRTTPVLQPELVDMFVYLLLHATAHMMKRTLRLITLYDLALMTRRMTESTWDDFRAKLTSLGGAWWAYPPLGLMERYFPAHLPSSIRRWLSEATTPSLRHAVPRMTIADVSYCNVRPQYVSSLLLWSRSAREAVWYAVERLSARGRTGWQTSHKWTAETSAFASSRHAYLRALRWFNPNAHRAGIKELFG